MEQSTTIRAYRMGVFALAVFYSAYILITGDFAAPGGPFRFLTIWALFMSLFVSGAVLMISLGRSTRRFDVFVSVTAVVNAMVVFLYWRLFFADPASVTKDGQLDAMWRELYMHGAGPLLMWIDALFINRVFRRLGRSLITLIGVVGGFILWMELFVGPFNDEPIGTVTSGLSYPFLNNMVFADRAVFYGVNITVAIVLLFVFAGVSWGVRRLRG